MLARRAAAALQDSKIRDCLVLSAIPLALSVFNASWLYSPVGYLDPWYNVAYFIHYPDASFANDYYKIARLPWLIPGYAAYYIFTPVVANYLLHICFLIVAVIFFYLTVRRMFGSAISLATAALLAVFVPFHGSGGWDYQNTGAGTYYIISFYLVTLASASKDRSPVWLLAGAAFAAAVHATMSFANLMPILLMQFMTLSKKELGRYPSRGDMLHAGLLFLGGGLLLTILLGLINLAVGRDFLFFKILLQIVLSRIADSSGQAAWWLPWSTGWFLEAPWYLAMPAAILVISAGTMIAALAVRSRLQPSAVALSLQFQYLLVGLLWIVWQSLGQTALQPDYFAYPIYPPMFFALAGLAALWQRSRGQQHDVPMWFAMLAGTLAAVPLIVSGDLPLVGSLAQHPAPSIVASSACAVGLFIISQGRPKYLLGAVAAFSAANVIAVAAIGNTNYQYNEGCREGPGGFYRALIDIDHFSTGFVKGPQQVYIWWDEDESLRGIPGCTPPISYFAMSLGSIGHRYLAPPEPSMPKADQLPDDSIAIFREGPKVIAVLTADPTSIDQLIERFGRDGVKLVVEGRIMIQTPVASFYLLILAPDRPKPVPIGSGETMSRRPRRNHTPGFKAKVALAAIKGDRTLAQLEGGAADVLGPGGNGAAPPPAHHAVPAPFPRSWPIPPFALATAEAHVRSTRRP
jgi:hypothetical protein